jgi:hypothetical protein
MNEPEAEQPASDERRGPRERRGQLEQAAALATYLHRLRTLHDGEGRKLTAAEKFVELLRTPGGPSVQRAVALDGLAACLGGLLELSDQLSVTIRAIEAGIERARAAEDEPRNLG